MSNVSNLFCCLGCILTSHLLVFAFHAGQRDKGVPEDKIIASRRRILKDKEMTKDHRTERDKKGSGERIIWSANNPNDFTFEVDGQEKTVADYNMEKYGIRLQVRGLFFVFQYDLGMHLDSCLITCTISTGGQHPNAPIICLGREGCK